MNVRDYLQSLVRTYVPIAVGALVSWLASFGLDVGGDAEIGLTLFLGSVVMGLYYLLARTLEARWPALGGFLLGSTRKPVYVASASIPAGRRAGRPSSWETGP